MAGCFTNVWIHRKFFKLLVQKDHQSFRNYYTEVIAAENKCNFHKKFCKECSQIAQDERILNRIIFGINDLIARLKLFEESDLNLIKSVQIIEAVRDTERDIVLKISKLFRSDQRKIKIP